MSDIATTHWREEEVREEEEVEREGRDGWREKTQQLREETEKRERGHQNNSAPAIEQC